MSDKVLERITFQPGDRLFKEGDEGNQAFVMEEGEVQIVKVTGEKEIVLATVGKGGVVGEMALLDDSPRMATARSTKGGRAIGISRQMFEAKMAKADPFVRGLLNILADHVRRMSKAKAVEVQDQPSFGPADAEWEEVKPVGMGPDK
ncbi:MAG: Crp/Fnr family transcriptional regulator [Rhodospirillaceae bacterium]|nr:Crp/Fnr family transcriptional regulator [Rhodospirillaceae bacterium]